MFFNSPASHSQQLDSRSRSCTDHIEGGRTQNVSGRRLFANLTRSRPASPDRAPSAREIERSQSQLNMSTFASLEQVASSQSEALARPASRNSRYLASETRSSRQPTLARSLLHKSSRLLQKRKSVAHLRGVSVWEDDDTLQRSTPDIPQRYLSKHQDSFHSQESALKHAISEPFNFQHLTHTSPNHARALANANGGDLLTEFCAMRAAQRPRTELKGIKATDLHSGPSSEVASLATPSAYQTPATSRPATPARERGLQSSKSADNFTQMVNWSLNAPTPTIMPPPRRSSRKPVALADVLTGPSEAHAIDSPTLPGFSKSPTPPTTSPVSHYTSPTLSTPATAISYFESPVEIAQAVTTPDNSAYEVVPRVPPPPPVPETEDVPDEGQSVSSKRTSTSSRPKSLRHTRSFPSVKHFSRTFVTYPLKKEDSNSSDPTLPVHGSEKEDIPTGRGSMAPKSMHESWEDSVDYCYDFALEDESAEEDVEHDSYQTVHAQKSMNSMSQPELSDSATSSAVSVPGIITPSELMPSPGPLFTPRDVDGSTMFPLSPSLLVPKEYLSRVTHEEQYQQNLSNTEAKTSFNFYEGTFDSDILQDWSARSSGSASKPIALTTSISVDSLSFNFAPLSKQRHSNSTSSFPELIKSQSSKEGLAVINGLAAFTTGVSDLPSTIDCLRGDLIRAAENIPEHEFAHIAPTLTPPPSRLAIREKSSSESLDQVPSLPTNVVISPHHPLAQRIRSNSAAQPAQPRQRGHRTSYSLFPCSSHTTPNHHNNNTTTRV